MDHDTLIESLRELWLTPSDLTFLNEVDPVALSKIVGEAKAHADRIHEGQRSLYSVMAKTTRLIPKFVVVRMSGSLSPYVLAQITEHLDEKFAAGLAKSFDTHLLSEIVMHLDTLSAARIATHTDLATLEKIIDCLLDKGLVRRLGEVSDALHEDTLHKLVLRMRDPERIAAIAGHMSAYEKLSAVAGRLDARLAREVAKLLVEDGLTAAARAVSRG